MLELQNITKIYGKTTVLQNASYSFPNTGLICLLGESGCGKTTLMNLIAGLDTDYTGKIVVDGTSLDTLSESELCDYRKDYIGFVFQDYHLLSGYTSVENIVYPCMLKPEGTKNTVEQAEELLNQMKLAEKANEKVQNLSGGQKQRVAIARALIKEPKMLLADEPTGALDRHTSTEIMQILKEISKTKLVVVITHDRHICDYADEVIAIENGKIHLVERNAEISRERNTSMKVSPAVKINYWKVASRNFRNSILRYMLVACIFAIGVLCVLLSISSGNIVEKSIGDFEAKNVAFHNGYIKNIGDERIYDRLLSDNRVEHVYKQYKLQNLTLSMKGHKETMAEKYPMPQTKEALSYGTLPRRGKQEIALTPSLAKKFAGKINELLGEELILEYENREYALTVSGIYNAGYDDFFLSPDLEQMLYQGLEGQDYYSISYDVKAFEEIVTVSEELAKDGIQSENASEQVETMQQSFRKIQLLFLIISGMILVISMFLVLIILMKMQTARFQMVGLLYSFGFYKDMVSRMIAVENLMLAILTAAVTTILLLLARLVGEAVQKGIQLSIGEVGIAVVCAGCFILAMNVVLGRKLRNMSTADALRN